jgi:hypothetical protein
VLIYISNHVPTFGGNIYDVFTDTYEKTPELFASLQRRKSLLQATLATGAV